jgi:hypothetical protein
VGVLWESFAISENEEWMAYSIASAVLPLVVLLVVLVVLLRLLLLLLLLHVSFWVLATAIKRHVCG